MGHCQPLLSMRMYWLASTYSATAMSTMVEAYNQHAYYMDVCSSSPSFSHYFSDTRIHHSPFARSPSVRWGHRKLCPVAKLDNVACGNRTRLTISASPHLPRLATALSSPWLGGKMRCLRFLTFGTIPSYDRKTVERSHKGLISISTNGQISGNAINASRFVR